MNLPDMIRAVQKALGVDVDGNAGPQTWQAIYDRICPDAPAPAASPATTPAAAGPPPSADKVDPRSESVIATLLPEVQPYARALVTKAAGNGITIKVISGLRTYAEQDEIYAQGRTKPGPIVTNAPGGYSNHNFGIAFDIGVWEENAYKPESPKYKTIGALGIGLGLDWGGNWTKPTSRIFNCDRHGRPI
jgi:peptidoglycan L-alanyl-D-glutamate endopeptidase CwlK